MGTWTNISAGIKVNENISCFAVSPDDDGVIYVAIGSDQLPTATSPRMYRTSNGGKTWINNVPAKSALIGVNTYQTGVDVEQGDPATVATCFSGFNAKNKVFISNDTGATWTNISTGLPNIPVD